MQGELKSLQRELGITTLYVTHDQQEALALSDRIAIVNGGDLVQVGAPLELYERPATDFVAGFLGDVNLVDGVVVEIAGGSGRIRITEGLDVLTPEGPALAVGKRVRLTIRPERLEITATEPAGPNGWRGRVREVAFYGELVRYGVDVAPGVVLKVSRPFRGQETLFVAGQEIWLASRPHDWRLFA